MKHKILKPIFFYKNLSVKTPGSRILFQFVKKPNYPALGASQREYQILRQIKLLKAQPLVSYFFVILRGKNWK